GGPSPGGFAVAGSNSPNLEANCSCVSLPALSESSLSNHTSASALISSFVSLWSEFLSPCAIICTASIPPAPNPPRPPRLLPPAVGPPRGGGALGVCASAHIVSMLPRSGSQKRSLDRTGFIVGCGLEFLKDK